MDGIAGSGTLHGFPHHIEQTRIHVDRLVSAPIPQHPVQFIKTRTVELAIDLVGNRGCFLRMHMLDAQGARVSIGDRIADMIDGHQA